MEVQRNLLVVEAPADLGVNLARVVVVIAAEGERVVEQDAAIGYVEGRECSGEIVREFLSQREVEGSVLRQIGIGVGSRRVAAVVAIDEA